MNVYMKNTGNAQMVFSNFERIYLEDGKVRQKDLEMLINMQHNKF